MESSAHIIRESATKCFFVVFKGQKKKITTSYLVASVAPIKYRRKWGKSSNQGLFFSWINQGFPPHFILFPSFSLIQEKISFLPILYHSFRSFSLFPEKEFPNSSPSFPHFQEKYHLFPFALFFPHPSHSFLSHTHSFPMKKQWM